MITDDGNVKRYLDSDIVDEFKEGQVVDISFPNGYNKAKRVHDECPTINQTTTQSSFITKITQTPLRIRKFTPKECWRLMGFSDTDFDKAAQFISNAQLYKQVGNSIVVDVLENIFRELFLKEEIYREIIESNLFTNEEIEYLKTLSLEEFKNLLSNDFTNN